MGHAHRFDVRKQKDRFEATVSDLKKYSDLEVLALYFELNERYGQLDELVQTILVMVGKYRPELYETLINSYEKELAIKRLGEPLEEFIKFSNHASKMLLSEFRRCMGVRYYASRILRTAFARSH